jgi:hypothetical protein
MQVGLRWTFWRVAWVYVSTRFTRGVRALYSRLSRVAINA